MSEIFKRYAKIAKEAGLISDDKESKELKNYKSDTYPRVGSDDISTIEALYGLKSDQEYKNNIMEQAHPNMVVVSPSHDKINGLFENNIERQNIIMNLVLKDPTVFGGQLQHKSAAKNELIKSLIRVANDMDNKDQEEIRLLADNCINATIKTSARSNPWSFAPAATPFLSNPYVIGGLAIAAVLGYAWFINKTLPSDQGVKNNCEKAISEMDDLTESHSVLTQWFHQTVNEETKQELNELKIKLQDLENAAIEYNNMDSSFVVNKVSDLTKLNDPSTLSNFKKNIAICDNYEAKLKEALPLMSKVIVAVEWSASHSNQDSDSSWLSTLKHVWYSTFSSDDLQDVVRYTKTLQNSCRKALAEIAQVKSAAQQKADEIEPVIQKMQNPEELPSKSKSNVEEDNETEHAQEDQSNPPPEDLPDNNVGVAQVFTSE